MQTIPCCAVIIIISVSETNNLTGGLLQHNAQPQIRVQLLCSPPTLSANAQPGSGCSVLTEMKIIPCCNVINISSRWNKYPNRNRNNGRDIILQWWLDCAMLCLTTNHSLAFTADTWGRNVVEAMTVMDSHGDNQQLQYFTILWVNYMKISKNEIHQ